MKEWFEVFRAGRHKAQNGFERDYTEADLDEMAEKYNSQSEHQAPIVIGHPKDNAPAYGWIKSLKREGDRLLALPEQVVQEFSDAVKQGLYKKRSISINPDGMLRHVGFLGAVPPAVKGLKDIEFNETENEEVFEFEEGSSTAATETVSIPKDEYESLKAAFSKATSDFAEASSLAADAEEKLKELYIKQRKLEFQTFINERLAYGNLLPKLQQSAIKLLEALDSLDLSENDKGIKIYEFSDSTKANPVDIFKEFLTGLPKVMEFSEIATKSAVKNSEEQRQKSQSEVVADEIRRSMEQYAK